MKKHDRSEREKNCDNDRFHHSVSLTSPLGAWSSVLQRQLGKVGLDISEVFHREEYEYSILNEGNGPRRGLLMSYVILWKEYIVMMVGNFPSVHSFDKA
jgi:hypothetical protein